MARSYFSTCNIYNYHRGLHGQRLIERRDVGMHSAVENVKLLGEKLKRSVARHLIILDITSHALTLIRASLAMYMYAFFFFFFAKEEKLAG